MKRSVQMFVLAAGFLGVGALSGCASDCENCSKPAGTASTAVVNKTCPIGGDEVEPTTTLRTSFQGKEVGFCCESCEKSWAKLSDADRQKKLAGVMK